MTFSLCIMYKAGHIIVALEATKRVNILRHDQSLPEVDNYPLMIVLEDLEFGVVYRTQKLKRSS